MSPFQTIRTYLFGGSPRPSAPTSEMEQEAQNNNYEQQGSNCHPPNAPALQPRRLTQVFHNTDSDAMLVNVPKFDRVAYDAAEFYCYVLMHLTSRDAVLEYCEELEQSMNSIGEIHNFGRLTSRLFIVAFCQDICCCANQTGDDEVVLSLFNLSYNKWVDLKDRLVLIRDMMLAKSADLFVLPGGDVTEMPPSSNEVDPTKVPLPMFGEYYADLLQKLLVHMTIAKFRERLATVEPEAGKALLKTIEAAVDEYKATLTEKVFKDEDVPSSLTSFLLQDLYQSNREDITILPVTLKQDVEKILLDESNAYSFRMLQSDVRNLFRRWHSTLTTPELVRLGYGGVKETYIEDDNRSVSSWGADEHLSSGKQMHSQPPTAATRAQTDDVDIDDKDEADRPTTAAAIEPIPHDSFEEEPFSTLTNQVIQQPVMELIIQQTAEAPVESGDDTEPLLERESDAAPQDQPTQDSSEIPSVTPTRKINRKRKASTDINCLNQAKRRIRNQRLRLEGFDSSDDENEDDDGEVGEGKDDDEDEDDEDDEYRVPKTAKNGSRSSPSKQRKFFTLQETEAIRSGVKRFGPGNWALIKEKSNGRLKNRSTIQIKDKYRTMLQNGEL